METPYVYSSQCGADVDLIFGAERIGSLGLTVPGDVLLSRSGSFLTITSVARMFLGEWIVDYVTADGRHGTIHVRVDVPVMLYRPEVAS